MRYNTQKIAFSAFKRYSTKVLLLLWLVFSHCNKPSTIPIDLDGDFRDRVGRSAFLSDIKQVTPPEKPKLSPTALRELEKKIMEKYGMSVTEYKNGQTLLHILASKGDLEGIKLIYQHPDMDINAVGRFSTKNSGWLIGFGTALHFAKDGTTVDLLIQLGIDIKASFNENNKGYQLLKKHLKKYPKLKKSIQQVAVSPPLHYTLYPISVRQKY